MRPLWAFFFIISHFFFPQKGQESCNRRVVYVLLPWILTTMISVFSQTKSIWQGTTCFTLALQQWLPPVEVNREATTEDAEDKSLSGIELVVQILLALSYLLFLPGRSPSHLYIMSRWHRSHIIPQNILCDEPVSKYLFLLQMMRKWLKVGTIFTCQCTSVVFMRLLLKVASLLLPEARQPFQEALPKPKGRCSM